LNDLHGGFFRYAVNALPFNFGKDLGTQLGIPNVNRPGYPNSSGLTNIDVAGVTSLGDSQWLPEHVFENIFQAADTVTWIKGKHSLKLGIDFRRQQRNFFQLSSARGYFNFAGAYTMDLTTSNGGNGVADLLFGAPISNEQDFLAGLYPTRYWDLAEFFQDDFRVNQKLTINLGLRYEITSPANGRVGNFDLNKAVVNTSYGPFPTRECDSTNGIGARALDSPGPWQRIRSFVAPSECSIRPKRTFSMISASIPLNSASMPRISTMPRFHLPHN
jgi:hypothetical protein